MSNMEEENTEEQSNAPKSGSTEEVEKINIDGDKGDENDEHPKEVITSDSKEQLDEGIDETGEDIQEEKENEEDESALKAEEIEGEEEEKSAKEIEAEEETAPRPETEVVEQNVEEEEEPFVEEPPPDPAAPFDFSDSKEALKPPFELRPEQIVEVELLWDLYQNYTPAYTDIDGFITEKELVYMLKALLLMTYTPEQLQELISYCVRPPHPDGHINYEQFLKMVVIRQRDFPAEDELRSALQVLDPDRTGSIDREYFIDVLSKLGHKMIPKQLTNFIKEVDISNDGTIGIEDVVGTMCIDLNKDDLIMLRDAVNQFKEEPS